MYKFTKHYMENLDETTHIGTTVDEILLNLLNIP